MEVLTSGSIKCVRYTYAVYIDQYHQRQFDLLRDIQLKQYSHNKFTLIFLRRKGSNNVLFGRLCLNFSRRGNVVCECYDSTCCIQMIRLNERYVISAGISYPYDLYSNCITKQIAVQIQQQQKMYASLKHFFLFLGCFTQLVLHCCT